MRKAICPRCGCQILPGEKTIIAKASVVKNRKDHLCHIECEREYGTQIFYDKYKPYWSLVPFVSQKQAAIA